MITRGKPTATLCSTSNENYYFEMYCYDAKGRINYKLSAYGNQWMKTVQTKYKFVGDILETRENVYTYKDGKVSELAKRKINNSYYSGTRLLKKVQVTHLDQNGKTNSQNISQLTYDVFGNLTANNRPGTAADMTYEYDTLHGWLKGISSPSGFSEQLLRETAMNAQYSGNIGSMEWRNTSKGEVHKYDYTYDDLGRLTNSQYSSSTNDTKDRYNEIVEYNRNGSITSLLRRGMMNNGTFGLIDNLTINYDGNQLQNVMDDAEPVNYNGALDFNDGDNSEVEYEYDSNGALKRDSNRGINNISYDYGHHPNGVSMDMRSIWYDYTPDGRKLSTSHATTISKRITNVTTDTYIDGLILRNGKPLMWQFDGGYVELDDNGTPTSWNYYITDHLGSTRKVVDSNNNVKETINYYPFGSEMRMSSPYQIIRKNGKMNLETAGIEKTGIDTGGFTFPADSAISIKNPGIMIPKDSVAKGNEPVLAYEDYWQRYRFSGKELEKQNGLNMYDFGARLFDVAGVPMWVSVDPLAEDNPNVTPYMYCAGDPVNKFDPDGKDWYQHIDFHYYVWFEGDGDREGFNHIGGKGSVLGEFEEIINNILTAKGGFEQEGLYSEGFTFDIASNDKGGLLGPKGQNFFDEFINGTGPEFSVMLDDHPYTEAIKNDNFAEECQNVVRSRGKNGKYTNVSRPEFFPWQASLTSPMQFIGTYRYDGYSSKDGRNINNVATDTKSVSSLLYHIPFTERLNHSRSKFKAFSTTYQFYIWRSKK